ncbi:hypothetical protein M0805_002689 [Coniferiporia weirii]|nr:hypothetical protein M0805_002689 [Coniferiporia weirii]
MLGATSRRRLALVEPATLKASAAPPSPSKQIALDVELSALVWNADNTALFAAAGGTIRRYNSGGHFEKMVHSPGGIVSALAVRDNGGPDVVYYAKDNMAYELDCGAGVVSATFEDHMSPVKSISLSADGSCLAVASASKCTVHNLSDSSQISLDGFPPSDSAEISICAFHIHSRFRIFVGYGHYLLIYDTSNPSAPAKSVALASSSVPETAGDIVAISCSPFSKSLIVVGCASGLVYMIDLEKEKGLFKTMEVKQSLSSLTFTADGAAILMGTRNGQLLVQDLRTINKGQGPKKIVINAEGNPVVGLTVQKKLKTVLSTIKSPTASKPRLPLKQSLKSAKPLSTQDTNVKNPASRRTSASTVRPCPSPETRTGRSVSAAKKPVATPVRRVSASKELETPGSIRPRRMMPNSLTSSMAASENSMNVSIQMETLPTPVPMRRRPPGKATVPKISPRTRLHMMAMSADGEDAPVNDHATKLTSGISQTGTLRSTRSVVSMKSNASSSIQSKSPSSTFRSRKESSASKAPTLTSRSSSSTLATKEGDRLAKPRSRTCSTVSTSTSASAAIAARKQVNKRPAVPSVASRTSSPDLEAMLPALPSPAKTMDEFRPPTATLKKGKRNIRGAEALRLEANTPDAMDGWLLSAANTTSDEGRRKVDFGPVEANIVSAGNTSGSEDDTVEGGKVQASQRPKLSTTDASSTTTLQLTPLRALGLRQTPSRSSASPFNPHALPNTPGSSMKMQEFLRTLMAPTLADFQQETRTELLGLHLDLLRLGRDWKRDMREAIGEAWTGEVQVLREENKRLREENERLRRGLY